jgi:hypothetical protein
MELYAKRRIEQRGAYGVHKNDNAFLAVDDVAALQAAADRLSPVLIRQRLDYWTLILGPKFSKKERAQMNLSRFYAIAQIEYCWNFIFKRHFPIHKIFERSCEIGLWRLDGQADPQRRSHGLPTLRHYLRVEPTPLRPRKAEGPPAAPNCVTTVDPAAGAAEGAISTSRLFIIRLVSCQIEGINAPARPFTVAFA